MKNIVRQKSISGLCACLALWLASCSVEDKGNYDLVDVNEVKVEGIESGYTKLSKVDNLVIKPEITGTVDGENLDNYEYTWKIQKERENSYTTIGTEKDLDWKVDVEAGSYSVFLVIKDKSTDLEWISSTGLTVSTSFTKGFLLLGEDENGEVRMDMVVMPAGRDTTVAERVFNNSELKLREPRQILFTGGTYSNQRLWLMAGDSNIRLTSTTSASVKDEKDHPEFTPLGDFNDLGVVETDFEHASPMHIRDLFPRQDGTLRSALSRGYITDDMIVYASVIQAEYFSTPINRYSSKDTKLFKPYPLAFMPGTGRMGLNPMFYDLDKQRFVRSDGAVYAVSSCLELKDQPSDPFPWNQEGTGRTIVYGENGYDSGKGDSYAIMKDTEDNYFIYRFLCPSQPYSYYVPSKKGFYQIDKTVAVDFDKATMYTFSSSKTVIVYAVGSKLYAYDYGRKQFFVRDMGAPITCLESEYSSAYSTSDIIVATYDSATHKGVVCKLTVAGGNNEVTIEDKPREVWPVNLKVKDIEWKNS